jgi:hypothetical protein
MIFDNLTMGPAPSLSEPVGHGCSTARESGPRLAFIRPYGGSKMKQRAVGHPANSNVSKILSLTTLRTIDLAGNKNPGPLFSRFWAKMRVFFDVFSALEYVHQRRRLGASARVIDLSRFILILLDMPSRI